MIQEIWKWISTRAKFAWMNISKENRISKYRVVTIYSVLNALKIGLILKIKKENKDAHSAT